MIYYIREDELDEYYSKYSNKVCRAVFSSRELYDNCGYIDIYKFIIGDEK